MPAPLLAIPVAAAKAAANRRLGTMLGFAVMGLAVSALCLARQAADNQRYETIDDEFDRRGGS